MKKHTVHILTLFMVIAALFAIPACGETQYPSPQGNMIQTDTTQEEQPVELVLTDQSTEPVTIEIIEEPETSYPLDETADTNSTYAEFKAADLSGITIPSYEQVNEPFVEINNNQPLFTDLNYEEGFEYYSELDDLDRPQTAMALISKTTMPAEGEERGDIGMIKPVGWHTVKYPDVIEDLYLYNRCHLIGWQLGAENANELNLITGTRYLNVTGMLPFENRIADYIKANNGHVLYRVTPVYQDNNLLCDGVLLEAQSIENDDCIFCVFCYNVQPDIYIDYLNGDSEQLPLHIEESTEESTETQSSIMNDDPQTTADYVLNTNTLKIHHPDCSSVDAIKPENRQDFNGTVMDLEDLIENQNYSYCQRCF